MQSESAKRVSHTFEEEKHDSPRCLLEGDSADLLEQLVANERIDYTTA
jgi:hypothetical protein